MKTPLSWISLYTPLQKVFAEKNISDLAHTYSIHTAEIDDIIPHFIDKIVVGKVISCEKHPESKKLSICRVFLGEKLGEETILTGAPNIIDAKYVPVAIVGAVLGGDFVIGERKMAGMLSRGMICAEDEIGLLSEFTGGIMILEENFDEKILENHLGKSVFDLEISFPGIDGEIAHFPLRDTTFEIDNKFITNRPDLFSIIGNAREWATIFGEEFLNIVSTEDAPFLLSQKEISVNIETEKCLAYSLLEMQNISTKKSPLGVRIIMERAGLNPKNDLVDITNLIMTEYGQPMHVFDADKVVGNVSVRMAKKGEILHALDDKKYSLTEKDIVIADENGPIALAGVIGGMETAVSETTKRVFWESATFDATTVRLTAQRHSLRTDASTRFEKSLDPTLAGKVFHRVLEYLQFNEQNPQILGQFSYLTENYNKHLEVTVPFELIKNKAGIEISKDSLAEILSGLGFELTDENAENFTLLVPSWRATKDISIAEDIVEEILRIYGYDNIPLLPLAGNFTIQEKNKEKHLQNTLLDYFSHQNFVEVYNYSFTNADLQEKFFGEKTENLIAIQNAYTEDFTHMRSSLAPRLFINIAENLRHKKDLQFFEIGKIYGKNIARDSKISELLTRQEQMPFAEKTLVAGVLTDKNIPAIREILENAFTKILGFIPTVKQGSDEKFLHPGASGEYRQNNIILAKFGKIHPQIATNFEIPAETLYFEIDFESLFVLASESEILFKNISQYQIITRELNFVLNKTTSIGDIAREIRSVNPMIKTVTVDSIFEDVEKIGENKKSVTFSFTVQSHEKTLSDEEIKEIMDSIIAHIASIGFSLRWA